MQLGDVDPAARINPAHLAARTQAVVDVPRLRDELRLLDAGGEDMTRYLTGAFLCGVSFWLGAVWMAALPKTTEARRIDLPHPATAEWKSFQCGELQNICRKRMKGM